MVSTIYTLTLQAQAGWARERFHPARRLSSSSMSAEARNGNGSVNGNAVDLSTLRIIDSCMLFDACTGKLHTINSSAVFIFDELTEEMRRTLILSRTTWRNSTSTKQQQKEMSSCFSTTST